jgi:hypothetical protein
MVSSRAAAVVVLVIASGCRRGGERPTEGELASPRPVHATASSAEGGARAKPTNEANEANETNAGQARGDRPLMRQASSLPDDPSATEIAAWWTALAEAQRLGFEPFAGWEALPDGESVRREATTFAARVLSPAFDPWKTGGAVSHTVHRATDRTPDILRHRFAVRTAGAEARVVVTETALYLRVDVEDRSLSSLLSPPERAMAVGRVASAALQTSGTRIAREDRLPHPYELVFLHDAPIVEGSVFSTARQLSLRKMWSWPERVDGGVQDGRVYFVAFRKLERSGQWDVALDPKHWFDGKCWEPYR